MQFMPMTCRNPRCGKEIAPLAATRRIRAASFADCIYQCSCGAGFSNAANAESRRLIWRDYRRNIPEEAQGDVERTIAVSLNERARSSKRQRFAFETSEDAVTWTLFPYLMKTHLLHAMLPVSPPNEMLLWGARWPDGSECAVRRRLQELLCKGIGEDPRSLSEPDVILTNKEVLTFIEVKYRSGNSRIERTKCSKFERYVKDRESLFSDIDAVRESGLYELTRNWVIGSLLAERVGQRFVFVNLGQKQCRTSASVFGRCLDITRDREFHFVEWQEALAIIRSRLPEWLIQYTEQKGLVERLS